jgi:hypothetical protein
MTDLPRDSIVDVISHLDDVVDVLSWSFVNRRHASTVFGFHSDVDTDALWRGVLTRAHGKDATRNLLRTTPMKRALMLRFKRFNVSAATRGTLSELVDLFESLELHECGVLSGALIVFGCDRLLARLLRLAVNAQMVDQVAFNSVDPSASSGAGSIRSSMLRVAACQGNANCAREILAVCAMPQQHTTRGGWHRVPLQEAIVRSAFSNNVECVSVLLAAAPRPWFLMPEVREDEEGCNLVHLAANAGSASLIRLLCESTRADQRPEDEAERVRQAVFALAHGSTPLACAVASDFVDCVRELLAQMRRWVHVGLLPSLQCAVEVPCTRGKQACTVLEVARRGHTPNLGRIAQMLEDAMLGPQ